MPLVIPTAAQPVANSLLVMGREVAGAAQGAVTYYGLPVTGFTPSNKVNPLEDKSLRGGMVDVYDMQLGPEWAENTIPASPVYGDTFGHALFNMLGDYTATGTAGTPTWTTSAALAAGAVAIPVTSGASAVAGTFVQIESTGSVTENVIVGTGSTSTNIVVSASTPVRFNHNSGVTIVPVTAPFTHSFNVLNQASGTGLLSAQPPSHALIHKNGLAGSGNFYADAFLYGCFTQLKITGKSNGWFSWEGKLTSYKQGFPGSAVTASFSGVKAIPAWRAAGSIASSTVYNVDDWSITLTRELDVITPADGQQAPYFMGRGPLAATWDMQFNAVTDESQLNHMFNNDQPSLQWQITNGGSGAGLISLTLAALLPGYKMADLQPIKTFWGYKCSGILIGNTTNVGNSAGYGSIAATLVNAQATY